MLRKTIESYLILGLSERIRENELVSDYNLMVDYKCDADFEAFNTEEYKMLIERKEALRVKIYRLRKNIIIMWKLVGTPTPKELKKTVKVSKAQLQAGNSF